MATAELATWTSMWAADGNEADHIIGQIATQDDVVLSDDSDYELLYGLRRAKPSVVTSLTGQIREHNTTSITSRF